MSRGRYLAFQFFIMWFILCVILFGIARSEEQTLIYTDPLRGPVVIEHFVTDIPAAETIAYCEENYRNCVIVMPERFPCYLKMQKAMQWMDRVVLSHDEMKQRNPQFDFQKQFREYQQNKRVWDKVIKECVQ